MTTATSADGTSIGYTTIGAGPDLVIVHGAMQSGASQSELAALLSPTFTVHLLDRRGRGASGPYPVTPSTGDEVEDVRAVVAQTGATRVLGISSGALISARLALAEPSITHLALFEPPLAIDGSVRLDLAPRLDAAIASDDLGTAMGLGMKIAEMGPPWMFGLPLPLLAAASRRMLATPGMPELAAALPADFAVVVENADRVDDFARVTAKTLLLSGTATRPYLRKAADALAAVIPRVRDVRLEKQSHAITQNRAERGRPEIVAPILAEFFAS